MGQPYALQLRDLERHVRETLGGLVAESAWQQTAFGPESHFRNKAKLVVGGTRDEPTFGILDGDQQGVDLRRCGLYEPGLHDALQTLTEQVARIGLVPYDVPRRTGELKHLVVTHAPTGALMVRFVLRSPGSSAASGARCPTCRPRCRRSRSSRSTCSPRTRRCSRARRRSCSPSTRR
ncbi:hypothetical protein [Barrientosiimonas endolithica]